MGVSKVVYGDKTLIDLTETTVTPETLLKGATAINSAGDKIEGTAEAQSNNLFFETGTESIAIGSLQFTT